MGKILEQYAIMRAIRSIDQYGLFERPTKCRRQRLYDVIVESLSDDLRETWYDNLQPADGDLPIEELVAEWRSIVPGLPDAMVINARDREVHFVEIEDSNPTSDKKLDLYVATFWLLDAVFWRMHLHLADRYGTIRHQFEPELWGAAGLAAKLTRGRCDR